MKIRYYPKVKSEDIPGLSPNISKRIQNAIQERLIANPIKYGLYLHGSLKGYRKLRVGDWRIIYRVIHNEIRILAIGNRRDVYQISDFRKSK